MRLNQYVAQATGMSRRAADTAIEEGRVRVNGQPADLGRQVSASDDVSLDGQDVLPPANFTYLVLNKPPGYVTSRRQQGNTPTIYELLSVKHHRLKPVGRLDKDSSGLLLLTDDGDLANRLTHPSFMKLKTYEVELSRPLAQRDRDAIESGVELDDGPSRMELTGADQQWTVRITEGRNRQIRRTFAALGYTVVSLHRTSFGRLELDGLEAGQTKTIDQDEVI